MTKKGKMAKNTNWHGTDRSKSISLFEYGLLVRRQPKENNWECVYRLGTNTFHFGYIEEEKLDELLTTDWAAKHRDSFFKTCGQTFKEWQESSFVGRVSDFITYFGTENLFGSDYCEGNSIKEMCKRFKIKYDEDFENN